MRALTLVLVIAAVLSLVDAKAYITYHNYYASEPYTDVACSDGHGIQGTWGYTTLSALYPNVAAYSGAGWNSPNCLKCAKLTNGAKTVYVTVIDQCGGAPSGYDAHFDVSPDAFISLYGSTTQGVGSVDWSWASSSSCKGNKGG